MLLLVILFLFSLFFIIIFPKYYKKHVIIKYNNIPPGPKGLPIVGNIHQLNPSIAPQFHFFNLSTIYGPILSLRFGFRSVVVIHSASLAQEVLKTQDTNFCNRPSLVAQQKLSYNGSDLAFAPYGDYYKEMRKLCVVHLFSTKKVMSFASIRREEVSRMIQKIYSVSSESESGIVNLNDMLMSLTSSILSRVVFGKRYKDEGVEMRRFHRLLHDAEAMLAAFFFSDFFPLIGNFLDKVTGQSSKLEKVFMDLDKFYDEIINDYIHQQNVERHDDDLIHVLLQLRKEHRFSFDLTLNHIKAILMNIIVAGTDTSAIIVIWAMVELIRKPTVMKKVQDELRSAIPNKEYIEEEDLPKLEYLKSVIKETFRLHPADPLLIARETFEKCTLQGYDILPKTLVFVNSRAVGRDPACWKDPEMFKPERFLESSVDYKGQNSELIPFGAGRRQCPGMLMGIANLELPLANLLYSFDWELPVGVKIEDINNDVIPGIAMYNKNPLCLVPKKFSH